MSSHMVVEPDNLFVTGLPHGMTTLALKQLFEPFGAVVSVKCLSEKRFGFVRFSTPEEAMGAMEAMHGFDYGGSRFNVVLARTDRGRHFGGQYFGPAPQPQEQAFVVGGPPSDRIYIKGLPAGLSEQAVWEVFEPYGALLSVRLYPSPEETAALLHLGALEQAQWLVSNLDGNIPQGIPTPVSVKFVNQHKPAATPKVWAGGGGPCTPPASRGVSALAASGLPEHCVPGAVRSPVPGWSPSPSASPEMAIAMGNTVGRKVRPLAADASQLYVSQLPTTVDDLYLYKVFAPFGAVQSVGIKRGPDDAWCVGFIKMARAADAQKAILGLNDNMLPDGAILRVSVKRHKPY